jgi:hypothetical protein
MGRLSNAALARAHYERETAELLSLAHANLEWALEAERGGRIADMEMYLDFACFHELSANDAATKMERLAIAHANGEILF